jgi:hypothetical protein
MSAFQAMEQVLEISASSARRGSRQKLKNLCDGRLYGAAPVDGSFALVVRILSIGEVQTYVNQIVQSSKAAATVFPVFRIVRTRRRKSSSTCSCCSASYKCECVRLRKTWYRQYSIKRTTEALRERKSFTFCRCGSISVRPWPCTLIIAYRAPAVRSSPWILLTAVVFHVSSVRRTPLMMKQSPGV